MLYMGRHIADYRADRNPPATMAGLRGPMTNLITMDDDDPHDRRQYWGKRICGDLQTMTDTIIKTGRDLIEAKNELGHGEFSKMLEEYFPLGERTAQQLMEIARNPVLANPTHVSHLPAHWGTLYELTKLPLEVIEAKIE